MRKKSQSGIKPNRHSTPAKAKPVTSDDSRSSLTDWFPLLATGALTCFLAHVEIFSPDIGFHLNHGRWIVENAKVPVLHPFLQGEFPYLDLSWAYQVVMWWLYRTNGTAALIYANLGMALTCFALLVWQSRQNEGRLSVWLGPVLALGALGSHWEIRPHTLSWIFLSLLLLLLKQHRQGRNRRALWFLPAIMLLWVNCHSLFALGVVVLGVYALDAALNRERRNDRPFWIATGAALGVCLINPYGLEALLYPLKQLGMLQANTVYKSAAQGIAEFQSPFRHGAYSAISGQFVLFQPVFAMQVYFCLTVSVVLFTLRRLTRIEALLLTLFGFIFVSAEKNFGYFFVATFPLVINRLRILGSTLAESWKKCSPVQLRTIFAGATVAALLLAISQVANGWYHAQQRAPMRAGTAFSEAFLPMGAARFLARPDIPEGKLLNTIDAGGFLAFTTKRKVFIDGLLETFGPHYYREYNELKDLKNLPFSVLQQEFSIVVVPYSAIPQWMYFFDRRAKWRLVHADARDAVFFAPQFAPHIPAIEAPATGRDYQVYPNTEAERIVRAHLTRPAGWALAETFRQHYYPSREIRLSAFHSMRGQPQASLSHALEGMGKATALNTDLLLNAGHGFFETGRPQLAALCYRTFLKHDQAPKTGHDPVLRLVNDRLEKLPAE